MKQEFFYRLHYTFWSGSAELESVESNYEFSIKTETREEADGEACKFSREFIEAKNRSNGFFNHQGLVRIVVREETVPVTLI